MSKPMIIRQPSMQNPDSDFEPPQILKEEIEQVASDRPSPRTEWAKTHSVHTPPVRSSLMAIKTDINTELSSVHSEDLTIMQGASSLSEAGDDLTLGQTLPPSPQQPPSIASVERVSLWPQKPGVVEQIESSSRIETNSCTSNPLTQFSSERDSKNLNAAGVVVVQNPDNTIAQYSDSAIHNPADTTVCQAILPLATELEQTIYQRGRSQSSQSSTLAIVPKNRAPIQLFHPRVFQDIFRASGSFTSRSIKLVEQFFHSIWSKIDLKQLQSRFHGRRQLGVVKSLEQSFSNPIDRFSEQQPSLEQYQKKLQELDLCRLAFARELASNGKFRNAIAIAAQIPETSHFFKDAQKLIQSWK